MTTGAHRHHVAAGLRRRLGVGAGWVAGGVAVLLVAGAVWWVSVDNDLTPTREARERSFSDVTGCLLTDAKGLADPVAAQVWTGFQSASVQYKARTNLLAIPGKVSATGAVPYVNSLILSRCSVIAAVGEAQATAARTAAATQPQVRFLTTSAAGPSRSADTANLELLPADPAAAQSVAAHALARAVGRCCVRKSRPGGGAGRRLRGRTQERSVLGRRRRGIAVAVFVLLIVQINAQAAVAVGSQVDTASPLELMQRLFDWSRGADKPPPGPAQESGTAAGKSSLLPVSATKGKGGKGRARGQGKGQLAQFKAKAREHQPFATGPGLTPGNRFDAQTAKPRPGMATATSETMEDAGGRLQKKVSSGRINYRKADGTYAAIDAGLEKHGNRYGQKANDLTVEIAARADDKAFTTFAPDAGHAVSAALDGATGAPAVVEGQKASFLNAFPSVDVELLSLEDGLKETFILKSADAPTKFVFPLALTGLTPRVNAETGVIEYVDSDGNVLAVSPHGNMEDANINPASGEGATSDGVTYELVTTPDGRPAIQVVLDRAWVRDPARKMPIRVDPSYTRPVSGDTFVDKYTPGADKSGIDTLAMGTYDNGTHLARALFQFSTLGNPSPVGYHTTAANLNVFLAYQGSCTAYPFDVYAIRASWAPATTNWNNKPALSASIGTASPAPGPACTNSLPDSSVGVWVSVPLTASVFDSWTSGNYGLALKAATDTGTTSWKRFSSQESTKKAYVSITYAPNVAPQVDAMYPEHDSQVYSLTPELMAIGHDPDTYPNVEVQYQFRLYDGATQIADSGLLGYGVRTWKVPANLLKWGRTYAWTAFVKDGSLNSPAQPVSLFTTTPEQPLITSTLGQNSDQGFDPNIGNYTTAETDAQISTYGPPLAVTRTYNSRDPRVAQAFGAGWSSIADLRASELRDPGTNALTGIVITYPDGTQVGFGYNAGDATFSPPLGRFATLGTAPNPTTYELVDKSGTAFIFQASLGNGAYGISRIVDARGHIAQFQYTGTQLTKMTSASNRSLTLGWAQPAGASVAHVQTVTSDPAIAGDASSAQVWSYGYTGDRLTQACPPGVAVGSPTGCSTYSYVDGSGYSTATLDVGPRSYLRLRDPAGTTTAADEVLTNQGNLNAAAAGVTFGSADGPLGALTKAASFDGTTSRITVPSDVADTGAAQSVALWFKTAATDRVLYGFQAAAGSAATTTGFYAPVLYIGTDGKLRGQFPSSYAAPITTTAAVNNNAWHYAVLTVNAGTQTLYLDGAPVTSITGQPVSVPGKPVATIGSGYLGGLWPTQSHYNTSNLTGYQTYFSGQLAEVADFPTTVSAKTVAGLYAAATRTQPLISKDITPAGRTQASVDYDLGAAVVKAVTDINGGRWQIMSPTVAGSSTGYRSAVLLSNPAAYWRFADQAGTQAYDEAATNYADYDNVTLQRPGPFGTGDVTAAGFNGTTSKVRTPLDLADNNGQLSVSLWFRTATRDRVLYSYSADLPGTATTPDSYTPALYVDTFGKLRGLFANGSKDTMSSPAAVDDNAWHHVVMTAAGTTQALYLDGVKVSNRTGTVNVTGQPYNIIGAGYLGSTWPDQSHYSTTSAAGYPSFFNGDIAEVAFYRFPLTQAQVSAQRDAYTKALVDSPLKYVDVVQPTVEGASAGVVNTAYDPLRSDRVVRIRNTQNYDTTYTYDTGGFQLSITDANGNTTYTGHDARGNVTSYTTCQDESTGKCSTEYYSYYLDPNGLIDPRNDRVLTHGDARSSSGDDTRYRTTYDYTSFGDVKTVTTPPVVGFPAGRPTITTYTDGSEPVPGGGTDKQPMRRVASTTTPGGAVQTFTYFANGDLESTTTPLGQIIRFSYDGLGRVATKTVITDTFPAGLVTRYTYDGRDQVLTQTDPPLIPPGAPPTPPAPLAGNAVTGVVHQAKTTFTYDLDGAVASEKIEDLTGGDLPRTMTWGYNSIGKPGSYTDARSKQTTYDYNLYGQKTKQTAPDGQVLTYSYDSEGRAWRTTLLGYTGDPNNPSTATDLVLESRAYDPGGRLATLTDSMGWETAYTYYDNGLPQTVQRRNPATGDLYVIESDVYDPASNLTERVTNNGTSTTRYVVDEADRVVSEVLDPDGLGRVAAYTLSADDFITRTETSQAGSPTEIINASHDKLGNLTQRQVIVGTETRTTTWDRDDYGRVTRLTEPTGAVTDYVNDSAGNLATTMGAQVNAENGTGSAALPTRPIFATGYNTFGEPTETRDATGNVTVTTYDAAGNTATVTAPSYTPPGASAPLTAQSLRAYNDVGQLISQTDPLGHQTTFAYTQLGDLATITAPGGAVTKMRYDTNGDLLATTSPTGALTEATFDYLGHRKTSTVYLRTPAQTQTTTYSYGFDGRQDSETSPAGVATHYSYDAAGQVTSIVDGANKTTRFTYDLRDRPLLRTLADGTASRRTYNAAGDLTGTADLAADGSVIRSTAATVDANGRPLAVTDPRGTTTTVLRDARGLVTQQTEPTGTGPTGTPVNIVSTFGYDPNGNRTRFTDGRTNSFFTTFNSWNLPATRTEPATAAYPNAPDRTWTWAYDADARPASMTAPGGVTRTRTYDGRDNLLTDAGSGAETATTTRRFGYDLDNRMISMSAPGGAGDDTFTWDDGGNLRTTTGGSGVASFTYNPDGRMTGRNDAAGNTGYTYDTAGRLASIADAASGTTQTLGYNNLSQVATISYGAGQATRTYGYDNLQRLKTDTTKAPGGTVTASITYDYDKADNLISKATTGLAGPSANTYGYDLANRLTSWTSGTGTGTIATTYGYDGAGNRTSITTTGGSSPGATTLTYDERNRLTAKAGPGANATYAYTARGTRSTTTTTPTGGGAASTLNSLFDAFDQLITETVAGGTQAGASTTHTYDGAGRVITTATTAPGGASPATTTFAFTGLSNDIASDGTTTYARDPDGVLIGIGQAVGGGAAGSVAGAGSLALLDDHTDVVAAIDAVTGAVRGSVGYDPLGKATARVGTVPGQLGYQSELTDPVTGKVNMLTRWFDPDTGQFSSRDSAWNEPTPASGEANGYGYLAGNPFAGTDPTGQWGWKPSLPHIPNPLPAIINTAQSVYTHVVIPVARAVVTGVKAVGQGIAAAGQAIGRGISAATQYAIDKARAEAQRIADAAKRAKEIAAAAAAAAKRHAEHVAQRVRKEAARLAQAVKEGVQRTKELGERVQALGTAISSEVGTALAASAKEALQAGQASVRFVDTHKAAIAGFAIGLAVGAACGATIGLASGGSAAPACLLAAGAVGSAATTALSGDTSIKGLVTSAVVGGLVTLATLGVGKVAAPALRVGIARIGSTRAGQAAANVIRAVVPRAGTELDTVSASSTQNAAKRVVAEAEDSGQAATRQATREEQTLADDFADACATPNSFPAGTLVLMADGSRKPIEDVAEGDRVKATNPVTGQAADEPVTALIRHDGPHVMVTISLDDGTEITATDGHPFWVADSATFLDAIKLRPGQKLLTAEGHTRKIRAVKVSARNLTAYNLTIGQLHTYYVMPTAVDGSTSGDAVLVHNCGENELFLPDEYYSGKLNKLAPGQSSPYSTYERFDEAGNLKQVTTYDRFGDRVKQYDIGPGTRHGEGSHSFEYDRVNPRHHPGGGRRSPQVPFDE